MSPIWILALYTLLVLWLGIFLGVAWAARKVDW